MTGGGSPRLPWLRVIGRVGLGVVLLVGAAGMVVVGANFGWCAGDGCEGWSRFWALTAGWTLGMGGFVMAVAASRVAVGRGRVAAHAAGWAAAVVVAYLIASW